MDYEELNQWYHTQGFNVIPIHFKSKQPLIPWKEWQEKEISQEIYERLKKKEFVNNNCAIITGKIYRGSNKDKFLCCIDIDNKLGIDEFLSHFGEAKSINELAAENNCSST